MNELRRQHVLLYVLIPILLVLGDISIHGHQGSPVGRTRVIGVMRGIWGSL